MPQDTTTNLPQDATDGGQQSGGGARTFTQQELDAVIADRLQRERAKFADYEDLKGKATKLAELEAAQKTELEKAQEKAAELAVERDLALQRANDRLLRASLIAAATKLSFADPEDAFALADLAGIVIGEDGTVTGAEEAVKKVAEKRPYLVAKRQAPSTDAGAGGGQPPAPVVQLTPEELEMAGKLGLTPERYARGKTQLQADFSKKTGGKNGK